ASASTGLSTLSLHDALPICPCGLAGLRTLPPRENGGNFDVKQLTKGAKLYLPVFKEGGLFSTGDGHFAQGDGEVCVTAVEMGARSEEHTSELQSRENLVCRL